MNLRPYQKRGYEQALRVFERNRRSVVLVMSPGAGKTVLGSFTAIEIARRSGGKVLWVAHRRELIKQAISTLARLGFEAGAIAPGMRKRPELSIQVASIQTLRVGGHLLDLSEFSVVVWDECHHAVSDDWVKLARQIRAHKAFLIGLTATPERKDGRGLAPLFGTMIVVASHRDLVMQSHLVPTEVLCPARVIEDGVADAPVTLWERHAAGTKTVVFCEGVDHAIAVCDEFKARGYDAAFVEGEMTSRERDRVIRRFVKGRTMILTNCQILTEGFDLPPIRTVVLARRIGSHALYLQMVGRGSRPFESKDRNVVLDLVGNARLYGLPEDDRKFSLKGKPIQLCDEETIKHRKKCKHCGLILVDKPKTCPHCGTPIVSERKRKVHGEKLERMTSEQAKAYAKAALDRLQDYARIHGKPQSWVEERYVKKFGRLP